MKCTRELFVTVVFVLLPCWASAARDANLIGAAKRDDGAAVTSLLGQGADVNAAAADGTTALHWAVHRGNRAIVDALLARGARPGVATQLGITPLDLACLNADAAMVRRLLDAGAAANTTGAVPPIMTCARTGSADAVAALLAHGANANAVEPVRHQTALMWAAAERHPEVVSTLIASGASVHARSRVIRVRVNRGSPAANNYLTPSLADVEEGGSTPLFLAARNGDLESTRRLLAAGAKVDEVDGEGVSPLLAALFGGHEKTAALLVEAGANIDDIRAGYAPLHVAVLRGDLRLVSLLLSRQADPNGRLVRGTPVTRNSTDLALPDTLIGATPFLLAAKFLEVDIMRALAAAGANAHASTRTGDDALMLAAGVLWSGAGFDRRDRIALIGSREAPQEPRVLEAVRTALDLGADVRAINASGETAIFAAEAFRYRDVAQLLYSRGAVLDTSDAARKAGLVR
jgi:ankyrin repeat protein